MERIQQEGSLPEVRQAKMKLVAAHARGEQQLLSQVMQGEALHQEALADFVAGLYATDLTEQEAALPISSEVAELSLRARQRALTAVFAGAPAQPVQAGQAAQTVQASVASFTQARKVAGLALVDLARRLGLGTDVVQKLEHGRLVAASIPQKLVERLAEALQLTHAQVQALLRTPPTMQAQPALLRRRSVGKVAPERQTPEPQTFAEAIQHSPSMTADQRAAWLNEADEDEKR
jgi:transcriptional regulator with XRE-family HTH domain